MTTSPKSYFIWWTNRADTDRILFLNIRQWPTHLTDALTKRLNIQWRGRIINEIKGAPTAAKWDNANPVCRMAEHCAGIIVSNDDYAIVAALPGFVTDFNMQLVKPRL